MMLVLMIRVENCAHISFLLCAPLLYSDFCADMPNFIRKELPCSCFMQNGVPPAFISCKVLMAML